MLFPKIYRPLFKNRDFFVLSLIIFIGQAASTFLLFGLIISVFLKTGSNIGVSGVILSFTIPAFFLMAFSGVIADVWDRRKIIIFANSFISLVVLVIILTQSAVYASIPLAFLYFAGNSFFIPASSAAGAQLVKKNQLLSANTLFIFNLAGGGLLGLFVASLIFFFFGSYIVLVICEVLLITAAVLSFFLPKLIPVKKRELSFLVTVRNVLDGFVLVLRSGSMWFFFVIFAAVQGEMVFAITLAPGFLSEVVNVSLSRAFVFIFPVLGFGVLLGVYAIQKIKKSELFVMSMGALAMGLSSLIFGLLIKFESLSRLLIVVFSVPFLIFLGFGTIVIMIASRTVLQKKISHTHQGTVFGANIILASVIASLASIMAVISEAVIGYLGTLVLEGMFLILIGFVFMYLVNKWKY